MNKYVLVIFAILLINAVCFGQNFTLPLWTENIPNHQQSDEVEIIDSTDIVKISYVQNPTISVYLPSKKLATGQAVVICPGGGYRILVIDWDGTDIAKWLNSKGITADRDFVHSPINSILLEFPVRFYVHEVELIVPSLILTNES